MSTPNRTRARRKRRQEKRAGERRYILREAAEAVERFTGLRPEGAELHSATIRIDGVSISLTFGPFTDAAQEVANAINRHPHLGHIAATRNAAGGVTIAAVHPAEMAPRLEVLQAPPILGLSGAPLESAFAAELMEIQLAQGYVASPWSDEDEDALRRDERDRQLGSALGPVPTEAPRELPDPARRGSALEPVPTEAPPELPAAPGPPPGLPETGGGHPGAEEDSLGG